MTHATGRYTDMLYIEVPAVQMRNEVGDLMQARDAELHKLGFCREEPSNSGTANKRADGTLLSKESEVYLHPDVPPVKENSYIKVYNAAGIEILVGFVKRYKKFKHYAKIWV